MDNAVTVPRKSTRLGTTRGYKVKLVKLEPGLFERLRAEAKSSRTSVNALINAQLARAVGQLGRGAEEKSNGLL